MNKSGLVRQHQPGARGANQLAQSDSSTQGKGANKMSFEVPHHVKGLEYFSLTACLKHFRQTVERDTGAPIQTLEVNAALFLDDVAKFVGLSDEKRRELLGKSAASFVDSVQDEHARPR